MATTAMMFGLLLAECRKPSVQSLDRRVGHRRTWAHAPSVGLAGLSNIVSLSLEKLCYCIHMRLNLRSDLLRIEVWGRNVTVCHGLPSVVEVMKQLQNVGKAVFVV